MRIPSIHSLSLATVFTLGLAASASAQSQLIGIETGGAQLFDIDPATGVRTLIGAIVGTSATVSALAYDDTSGELYMSSTSTGSLYTLDLATLTSTVVGSYGLGSLVQIHGLEDVPATGKLYGKSVNVGASGGGFYEIDKLTGQATLIATLPIGGFGSLSYVNGTMYLSDTGSDSLYSIDLVTGVTTLIGPFGVAGSVGVGFAYSAATGLLATDNSTDALYSINLMTGAATLIGSYGASNMLSLEFIPPAAIGTPYCTANPNSTGAAGVISASGSASVAANDLTLNASQLPSNAFGFFLTSMVQANTPNPGGSQGILCLGGSIGRFVGPGQIQNSGATGMISLAIDNSQQPTPNGLVQIAVGETWNFQAWYRDSVGGAATSNLTGGLEILFN